MANDEVRRQPGRRHSTVGLCLLVAAVVVVAIGAVALPSTASAQTIPVPANQTFVIDGHGNGHGHGMSQYGAQGAARRGLSTAQILAFYYPGASPVTLPVTTIRVLITNDTGYPTVAAQTGLAVTGISGALPEAGVLRWRLVPSGAGLALQRLVAGTWSTYRAGLPARADFRAATALRLVRGDGSLSAYRGSLGGVRFGAGVITVNRLSLEDYTRGVVAREMPASWPAAAVQAQAVAARTYARYEVEHQTNSVYDICDTSSCQVYGGIGAENPVSNAAIAATANRVLSDQGSAIFAQFTSANGGWSSAGGQPYLMSKADPYEQYSDSPYSNWTRTVSAATLASYYGLSRVSDIKILARDGGGQWGGRVTSVTIDGVRNGAAATLNDSGVGLKFALGLPDSYFQIRPTAVFGVLDWIRPEPHTLHAFTVSGWVLDPNQPGKSAYAHIYVDRVGYAVLANVYRPDVQRATAAGTALLGFRAVVTVPGGTHTVCAYAVTATSAHEQIRCQRVTVGVDPGGYVDAVSSAAGRVTVRGWVLDPDSNGGSTQMHVYVDAVGHAVIADGDRPDVQRAYGLANAALGFTATVPVPPGRHDVCMYAINNAGAGHNRQLKCVLVTG